MTNPTPTADEHELIFAQVILEYASRVALYNSETEDLGAYTSALIARAFELSTPGMSARNRATIFWSEQ